MDFGYSTTQTNPTTWINSSTIDNSYYYKDFNLSNGTYYFYVRKPNDNNSITYTGQLVIGSTSDCSISLTANPTSCNNTTNLHNISGIITLTNPPSTGTLIVTVDGVSQSFNSPFNNTINYNLVGINSNGLTKTVNVSVGTCSGSTTYISPASCVVSNNELIIYPPQNLGVAYYNSSNQVQGTYSKIVIV